MPVICPDFGVAFYHNPKTGGRSVTEWMVKNWGGKRVGDWHETFGAEHYPIRFAVVRDPIERFTSYAAMRLGTSRHGWTIKNTGDVLDYMEWRDKQPRSTFQPQSRFLRECSPTHVFVFPHLNTIARMPWWPEYRPITETIGKAPRPYPVPTPEQIARLLYFEATG